MKDPSAKAKEHNSRALGDKLGTGMAVSPKRAVQGRQSRELHSLPEQQ